MVPESDVDVPPPLFTCQQSRPFIASYRPQPHGDTLQFGVKSGANCQQQLTATLSNTYQRAHTEAPSPQEIVDDLS